MSAKNLEFRLPKREPHAHKGSVGRVLVVAGSRGLSGAAYLCSKAALRAGAGLVTLACPESIHDILEIKTTCVMTVPLADEDGGLAAEAFTELEQLASQVDAVAVGPGLGQRPGTAHLVMDALPCLMDKSLVLDADALNILATHRPDLKSLGEFLRSLGPNLILTPHPGEMARLLGCSTREVQDNRRAAIKRLSERIAGVVVLKGHGTLVAQGSRVIRNHTGHPGMATAGAGDVLTGLLTALCAAGCTAWEAACMGVHIHGLAGDLWAAAHCQTSLIATDLLETLVEAIAELEDSEGVVSL